MVFCPFALPAAATVPFKHYSGYAGSFPLELSIEATGLISQHPIATNKLRYALVISRPRLNLVTTQVKGIFLIDVE